MSDETKKLPKVGRRDSLKLATAVTALGAGLGIVLDGDDAVAGETVKMRSTDIGNLSIKLFKHDADGKSTLLDTIDVGSLSSKMSKGGAYSIKMYGGKLEAPAMITEQALAIEPARSLPAVQAPPQAPAVKR